MSGIFRYLVSKTFFKQLLLAFIIMLIIFLFVFITLRLYTDHGESSPLPDFRGLTLEQADSLAQESKLKIKVIDSVFLHMVPRGTVVDQNPPVAFKVKDYRTVFLTMNAHNPERIPLPKLTGVSFRQAKAVLESFGLALGKIHYRPDIAKNLVLAQLYKGKNINPGDTVVKGDPIDLVLGNGLSNIQTYVPRLIGKTIDEAKETVSNYYLNLGATVYDNTVANRVDSLSAMIFKQKPDRSTSFKIPQGSFVDIWLTMDSTKIDIDAE